MLTLYCDIKVKIYKIVVRFNYSDDTYFDRGMSIWYLLLKKYQLYCVFQLGPFQTKIINICLSLHSFKLTFHLNLHLKRKNSRINNFMTLFKRRLCKVI